MPCLDCDEMTVLWRNDCWRGGEVTPFFFVDICSSWVERSLHVEFQLLRKLIWYWPGVVGPMLDISKLRLTHPSLAGSGSELGNIVITVSTVVCFMLSNTNMFGSVFLSTVFPTLIHVTQGVFEWGSNLGILQVKYFYSNMWQWPTPKIREDGKMKD